MKYLRSKRAPYAVPALVVVAVGAVAAGPALSSATPPPLPAQTPQQLLVDMAHAQAPELSGSVALTANLGFPDLSSLEGELGQSGGGGFNPLNLLAGSNQFDVWLGGGAEHLALSQPAEEIDLVRNGNQVWYWDSSTGVVAHFVAPEHTGGGTGAPGPATSQPALTPDQLASGLLAHLAPTTSVTTGGTTDVAGQAAYRLLVAPKGAGGSTVSDIEVDIGATGALAGVPLQVAIYAVGQAAPALELGFTGKLNLGPPAAGELTFSPPPGARVVTHDLSSGNGLFDRPGMFGKLDLTHTGTGWATVVSGASTALANPTAQADLNALTSPVQVGGQQARLLSSNLLNVLIMPGGHFYAGLVTPGTLETDASGGA